ncbi:chymotrypsin-2-like [Brevipalpus obovatus]|uniref:chymotrypsin-2-like n=1 Tax=Brevipalpus obovatus TaxID=246614 RepID=UPI003D9F7476
MYSSKILLFLSSWLLIEPGNAIAGDDSEVVRQETFYKSSYLVSLRTYEDIHTHICGGSAFHQGKWILTARSCLLRSGTREPLPVRAYPGLTWLLPDTKKVKDQVMTKSFCHPFEKNQPDSYTDIGLVKLQEPLPLKIHPTGRDFDEIKLLREDLNFVGRYDEPYVYLSGWGSRYTNSRAIVGQMRHANFSIKSPSICKEDPKAINFTHPNHICIQSRSEGTVPCFGDDGGPALYFKPPYWALLGVIPAVPKKCDWQPFVMNISHFREFIDDVVRHEPSKYECRNPANDS